MSHADVVQRLTAGDRSDALCLLAVAQRADAAGRADLHDVVVTYRSDYLQALEAEGRDIAAEAGRLSVDEVRAHLVAVVLPRLVATGAVATEASGAGSVTLLGEALAAFTEDRERWLAALQQTGEHPSARQRRPTGPIEGGSVLAAAGLVKTYKKRHVVNDVSLELRQGEIVGLLGPNGAGKTTTFYMVAGLIPPAAGKILLDGEDITRMPMYKRARRGIGYLSQEPSIFRKLSVEENILAILETLPLSKDEREHRLDTLLDELKIKHLRLSKAYALSGGERRRLEITRALVTQPKFIMLDEPFAGVDPIAVIEIQRIVRFLKERRIGVLITDHNVRETLGICDRAYIIRAGTVLAYGRPDEVVQNEDVRRYYLGEHFSM